MDLQAVEGIIFQSQLPDGAEVTEKEQVCPDKGYSIPEFPFDQELSQRDPVKNDAGEQGHEQFSPREVLIQQNDIVPEVQIDLFRAVVRKCSSS